MSLNWSLSYLLGQSVDESIVDKIINRPVIGGERVSRSVIQIILRDFLNRSFYLLCVSVRPDECFGAVLEGYIQRT
jgi:hypothetical protein